METETNMNTDFPDILSAALDESGISGDFDDFSFSESDPSLPCSNYSNLVVSGSQSLVNSKPRSNLDTAPSQADIFSQALKQLSSSPGPRPAVIRTSLPSPKINYVLPKNAQSLLASPATSSPHSPATARIIKVRSAVPLMNRGGNAVQFGAANGDAIRLTNITGANRSIVKQTTVPTRVVSLQQLTQNGQKISVTPQGQLIQRPSVIVNSQRSFITNASSLTPQGKLLNGKKIIIRSSSPGALSAALPTVVQDHLQRSNSPLTILNQNGLSGGQLISNTGRNSPTILNANHQSSVIPTSLSSSPVVDGTNLKSSVSSKDLSRLWSNEDVKLKNLGSLGQPASNKTSSSRIPQVPTVAMEEEEVEEEVEELGHAETYNEYMPTKLDVGEKHPDPVVETSSLASVEPPDVTYRLSLSETIIDCCLLSALQLESVTYASQRHDMILRSGERAGYLIGDGAGVGKGRTLAGIIFENYLLGRKRAIWLSVSNDLRIDAERDLHDIGAGKIDVHPLNKLKYAKISSKENGSIKKGVIFSTYSSLIGESTSEVKYKTRLKQLLKWCGKDFDGVIVFDECHKAKNLCPVGSTKPTKTGQTVLELQNRLPKARVVYASATGASEPKNMAYMTRLGLWGPGTPFKEFNDFIQAVEKRGVGAMELVAMDMKLRGMYIARQLSFHGVTFKIEEIPLSKDYKRMYNDAVKLWVEARDKFQRASELIQAEQRMRKSMWGQFWSSHQRFFKYLCLSAKVDYCVSIAREAVRTGKCCVIGLQSTGEARTLEQLEEAGGELNDFVSTAKGVIQTLVEKHFPAPDRKKTLDLFGFGSYMYNNNNNRDLSMSAKKRKIETTNGHSTKKLRKDSSSGGSDSDPSNSDFSDLSLSSDSDSSSNDDNPFGLHGSDSDDDPWLKKSMKKQKKEKKKPKEKKKKKKKSSTKVKERSDDEDQEFDRALAAAGLLKRNDAPVVNSTPTNINEADAVEMAFTMKRELLEKIEILGEKLPPNTLDHLIDELGGPENVAEMTGRKGRVVSTEDGVSYESRSESDVPLEILNLTEKQRFMDGEKLIAVISEAASSGISLQADRRVNNQRRRVHITLELPWSADRAVQQFGRTHRSNQVSSPEYIFLISDLAGERRFASTVAKRLEALGALTHGDRRATESRDLSRFNIDNKYGRTALDAVMKSIANYEAPLVPAPKHFSGDFFEDVKFGLVGVGMLSIDERVKMPMLEKDYNNISKFLNRILGMEVEVQNALFDYFSSTLTSIVLEAKRSGRWDLGILDLGSGGESVKKVETKTFLGNEVENIHKTELTTVSVERGMSWLHAMDLWRQYSGTDDGFYISSNDKTFRKTVILAVVTSSNRRNKDKEKLFSIYKPNTGLQAKLETVTELKNKYKKILPDVAERCWTSQYDLSAVQCSHKFWKGSCRKASLGLLCEIGLRTRTYHILSGSVLSVWGKVESVLASQPGGASSKMQIIRLKTDAGQRIVGSLIPSNCLKALTGILSQDCQKTLTEKHSFQKKMKLALVCQCCGEHLVEFSLLVVIL